MLSMASSQVTRRDEGRSIRNERSVVRCKDAVTGFEFEGCVSCTSSSY